MERTNFKTLTPAFNVKKLALTALIAAFSLTSFSAPLPELLFPQDSLIQLTSLGIQDGDMIFKVKTDNLNEDKLYIVLSDKDGTALYKGIFSEKYLAKTFKVPSDIGSLSLMITNLNNKTVERFEISNEKKMIEELVITTIK